MYITSVHGRLHVVEFFYSKKSLHSLKINVKYNYCINKTLCNA